MGACRSCGAAIRFVTMQTGRSMPCDEALIKTYVVQGFGPSPITLITERGEVAKGQEVSFTREGAEPIEGYRPHWATCTDPKKWRKGPGR